jgi:hypothetical protein
MLLRCAGRAGSWCPRRSSLLRSAGGASPRRCSGGSAFSRAQGLFITSRDPWQPGGTSHRGPSQPLANSCPMMLLTTPKGLGHSPTKPQRDNTLALPNWHASRPPSRRTKSSILNPSVYLGDPPKKGAVSYQRGTPVNSLNPKPYSLNPKPYSLNPNP